MRLGIIIIGDEILMSQVTDTNSGDIARLLGPQGWQVTAITTVGDNGADIRNAIDLALQHNDLVITTGGLGPTKDDITKTTLAEYTGGSLVLDPEVSRNVEEVFAKRGLQLNTLTRLQAMVPDTCRVIQNRLGTAPIMWFDINGKVLISMPGVPFETVGMLRMSVIEEISRHFAPDINILHSTLIVTGITESDLAQKLSGFESSLPQCQHLAYLPDMGYIRLRLDTTHADADTAAGLSHRATDDLRRILGPLVIHQGDATPAEILLDLLRKHHLTVSTAESCTGGNIAHQITSVAGCSDRFMGSVVSYSNDVKHRVLSVSTDDLDNYGAVSRQVVAQMARGVAALTRTDCSMATSGIAGPGGGSPDKPVGTVWMAIHTPAGTVTECQHFAGDRSRVISRATSHVIIMLIKSLSQKNAELSKNQ